MTATIARMNATESRAWIALITTAELLPTALDAQLQRDSSLTHYEFIVLNALQYEKEMRLSDLAAATNATLPRASKVVSRMQQRGLLERLSDGADRRAVRIRMSSAGRRAFVHAMPSHLETVRELVLNRLSDDQLSALGDALEPIVAALDPQHRFPPRRTSS